MCVLGKTDNHIYADTDKTDNWRMGQPIDSIVTVSVGHSASTLWASE